MSEFVSNISLHAPLISHGWNFLNAFAIAFVVGAALSLYCKTTYRSFAIWGFLVGLLGFLFFWLILTVLPINWALIVAGAIGLPIGVLFYVDEQSIVTAQELSSAAAVRETEIRELYENDPDAAQATADILNLGIDAPSDDWPEGSKLQGIPKRVVRNAVLMLIVGFGVLGFSAFVIS